MMGSPLVEAGAKGEEGAVCTSVQEANDTPSRAMHRRVGLHGESRCCQKAGCLLTSPTPQTLPCESRREEDASGRDPSGAGGQEGEGNVGFCQLHAPR